MSATVVSESYIRSSFPGRGVAGVFDDYLGVARGLVIFTFGEKEIWYGRPGMAVRTARAYAVEAVDTSCAGDAFRAGIVFGFLKGWDDPTVVDFAAAVAGIVCTRTSGALNSPSHDEVRALMQTRRA